MEACASTAEEAMEGIIPTIMSALSMNETDKIVEARGGNDTSTTLGRRRSQSLSAMPSARITVESIQRQQTMAVQKDLCGTTECANDEIIPTIMHALSFRDTTEEIPRLNSTVSSASHQRRRLSHQQQEPQIDADDTASILKSLETKRRELKQEQRHQSSIRKRHSGSAASTAEANNPSITSSLSLQDNSGGKEGMIPALMNSFSFSTTSENNWGEMNNNKSDLISPIVKALSFGDTSEETMKRSRRHGAASPRQLDPQIPMGRMSSNSSHRRRRPRQQERALNDVTENTNTTTITEEDSVLVTVSDKGKGSDSKNAEKDQTSTSSWNAFSMMDESDGSAFSSIRNVFTTDDAGRKGIQNDTIVGNGVSQVYPFIRNVFSMNDADTSVPLNTTEEISDNSDKVRTNARDEEEGNNLIQLRTKRTQKIVVTRAYEVKEHYFESIFYVSISAILGSVFRVYMARIFGFDCQAAQADDFLVPFSSSICVTNNGRTAQTGGALFTDFPSNVFGSFLMGMITPPVDNRRARLPWLHRDHPLQRDEVFHASLGTGFCGCLTTFASWNTQMVVMLDGTYCQLGSQVVTVLFGYLLGLMGASWGFQLGRQCGLWMYNFKHKIDDEVSLHHRDGASMDDISESQPSPQNGVLLPDEGIELVDDDNSQQQPEPSHLHKVPLFLAAVTLLAGFVVGDVVSGIGYYKGMILLWVLSPVGSLLRWKLSGLNKARRDRIITNSPGWIPWGTFFANLIATILSASMEGLYQRYFEGANPESTNQWVDALLFALKTGVAGSLSTVSSMVKESVQLSEDHPDLAHGHYYSMLTCVSCCLVGLAVYSTTIRLN